MPEDLVNLSSISENINIYDPNLYLNHNSLNEMIELTTNIKIKKKYEIFIYIISSIDRKFGNDKDKNISWFTNDLSYLKLKSESQRDDNSIFIVLAMEDRQSHLRTGRNVKDYLQDSKCSEYLESINYNLKSKDYDLAILNLLKKIEGRLMIKNQTLYDIFEWFYNLFIALLWILIFGGIWFLISYLYEKKISKSAEDQLKKLKKITDNNKPRREIIERICVICLDELENKENSSKEECKEKKINANSLQELEISEENLNKEQAELIKKNEEIFIAKLECGHSFHSKCISVWMVKNNICPICREKIDKEEDSSNEKNPSQRNSSEINSSNTTTMSTTEIFTRSLINIQSSIHPELSSLDYSYGTNFSWRFAQSSSSTIQSSYSFEWGSGSGGASSSW
jgi:uncharacterized membrane protein YgcG